MEYKISVTLNTDANHTFESAETVIGRAGEGSATRMEITIPTELTGCSVYLDFEKPNGEKLRTPKLKRENSKVVYDVEQYLLTDYGEIKVQAVCITENAKIWKSSKKKYHILKSINAYDDVPEKEDLLTQTIRAIERIEETLTTLKGTIVIGLVDENNVITIAGKLPDGTYTAKYVMGDGSTVDIGEFEYEGSTGDSTGGGNSGDNSGGSSGGDTGGDTGDNSGTPTNWIKEVGYTTNTRLSSTSGETKTATDYECTDFIRAKYNDVLYIKNVDVSNDDNTLITFYDIEKTPITVNSSRYGTTLYWFFVSKGTATGDVYSSDIVKGGNLSALPENFDGYIRICSKSITADSILRINQAIS